MSETKKRLIYNGATNQCVDFFMNNIKNFGRVVRLVSFFDNQNFLLTKYNVDNDYIHTIIENDYGDEIQLSGANCGYGGEGPNGTRKILEYLGVPSDTASKWIYHDAIIADFTENKILATLDKPLFFGCSHGDAFCRLDNNTFIGISDKVVYMIAPSLTNLSGYYNCLDVMQPLEVCYSFGSSDVDLKLPISLEILNRRLNDKILINRAPFYDKLHMNMIIYGNRFSIIGCLAKDEILPLIYSTHLYLLKTPIKSKFFSEHTITMDKISKISIFNKKTPNNLGNFIIPKNATGGKKFDF